MGLVFASNTDVGKKRRNNQDRYKVLRSKELNEVLDALFIVADGMGGRQGGEVAAQLAVETLIDKTLAHVNGAANTKEHSDIIPTLKSAVAEADKVIRGRQETEPELAGMGTTCVAAALDANILTVVNVGDSRAYLLRDGKLTLITEDHSEIWNEVKAGHLTQEEAQRSRFRNIITRALGAGTNATPDVFRWELREGDTVMLCSDGLNSEVLDPEIEWVLAGEASTQTACDRLIASALEHGGKDNVTIVIMRFGEFTPIALPRPKLLGDSTPTAKDPSQDWKNTPTTRPISAASPQNYQEPDTHALGTLPPETQPHVHKKPGMRISEVLAFLFLTSTVLICGLCYFLWNALINTQQQASKQENQLKQLTKTKPQTTMPSFNSVSPFVGFKRFQENFIAGHPKGGVYLHNPEKQLIHLDLSGQVNLTGFSYEPNTGNAAKPTLKITDGFGFTYEVQPPKPNEDAVLTISSKDGEPTKQSLAKVKKPVAITMDGLGNLFILSEKRVFYLKRNTIAKPKGASEEVTDTSENETPVLDKEKDASKGN